MQHLTGLRRLGLAAYWSMDEQVVGEQVGGGNNRSIGTRRIPGHCGHAREFVPAEEGRLDTEFQMAHLGAAYTISCWLRARSSLGTSGKTYIPVLAAAPTPPGWGPSSSLNT